MTSALASLTGIVGVVSLVAIYAAFALSERQTFARKLGKLSDDPAKIERLRAVVADVNARIGTYLVMKTLINVLLGAISYLILRGAGVEFAGFWAILIGTFNYIPYVGSFIGVFFPVALSVLQFGDLGPVIALGLLLAGAQMLVGNVIEPWLMGSSLNLSPFVIMVSLVAWTAIWGIPGAILSVPITAILVIVLSEFPGTRPIAVLLSRDGELGEDARRR
jgi:predicted PurR-regulated permease PerM